MYFLEFLKLHILLQFTIKLAPLPKYNKDLITYKTSLSVRLYLDL